ncbi:Phospholipase A1 [Gryllus bimaculatus]|nr:Phospholipase A1 [Gryllus bimaculatus]
MRRFGLTRKLVRNRQQFWKFSVILPHYENDDIGAILNNLYTAVTLFEGVGSWIAINFKARLPFFEGHDRLVRLDHGDAAFVEVVHTDAKPTVPLFGMGMVRQHGHVDYYINGGFAQPGCSVPSPFPEINSLIQFCQLQISVISQLAACAHNRATVVSVTAHYSDEYLPPAYEKCAPDSCSPLNLQNVMYPARGGFVVPSAQSQPFCIVEPEVDDIMKDMEKAVETFRNFTHDYSTKVRASIFRRVEKVGKTVGRKVGSMRPTTAALRRRTRKRHRGGGGGAKVAAEDLVSGQRGSSPKTTTVEVVVVVVTVTVTVLVVVMVTAEGVVTSLAAVAVATVLAAASHWGNGLAPIARLATAPGAGREGAGNGAEERRRARGPRPRPRDPSPRRPLSLATAPRYGTFSKQRGRGGENEFSKDFH